VKIFGALREIVATVFRKDGVEVTLKPNSNTYLGATEFQLPPKTSGNGVLVASGDIVNADIAAGAGIEGSKVQAANGTTNAGVVSTGAQDFGGVKTFLSNPVMSGLTASQAVVTDSSKNLASLNYGSTNTVSTLVQRDASGNFAAGTITANLTGNVSGSAASFTGSLSGEVTGTQSATIVASGVIDNDNISASAAIVDTKLATISTAGKVANSATTATTSATPSTIVLRDGSGNISGAQVSGNISGSAANVTGTVAIANGGTGQTSANAALNALLPLQLGSGGKFLKTDGTDTSWASASGGAGEINAVLNASGADGTTGWTAGTSHSINTATGVTMPLSPVVATAFTMSSLAAVARLSQTSSSGDYYEFTMPPGLQNKKLKLEFYAKTPASADGTWAVALYKGSTKIILSTDTGAAGSEDTVLLANTTYKFVAYFDADASATYRVNFVQRSRTNVNSLYVTNVIVGPGIQPQGAVVGEWTSYTPTLTGTTTNVTHSGSYRRVGSSAEVRIMSQFSGTNTQGSFGGAINSALPSVTINTAALPLPSTAQKYTVIGVWEAYKSVTNASFGGEVSYRQDTGAFFLHYATAATSASTVDTSTNIPFTVGSGDTFSINFTVPIAEWAGSGTVQLAQNDVEYASNSNATNTAADTTSFAYGPTGSLIPNGAVGSAYSRTVKFQSVIQPTDVFIVQVDQGTGQWIDADRRLSAYTTQATLGYGIQGEVLDSTTYSVVFGAGGFRATGATYASNGAAWSGLSAWRWRVRKMSAGAAVGFGIVQPGTSAGLVSASGLPGNTTGNAVASGYVGQTVPFTSRQTTGSTGAFVVNTTALATLDPGIWIVYAKASFSGNNAASFVGGIVSTNTSADNTGQVASASLAYSQATNAANATDMALAPVTVVNVATSQPLYAKSYSEDAAVNVTITGFAVRIA
jgi:hypothetical protein